MASCSSTEVVVVDLVVGVGRGDVKFTHEAGHATEDAGYHFDAFGSVGIAVWEV